MARAGATRSPATTIMAAMAPARRDGNRVRPSGRRSLACSSPPFSRRQTSARATSASAGSSAASLEVASAHPRS